MLQEWQQTKYIYGEWGRGIKRPLQLHIEGVQGSPKGVKLLNVMVHVCRGEARPKWFLFLKYKEVYQTPGLCQKYIKHWDCLVSEEIHIFNPTLYWAVKCENLIGLVITLSLPACLVISHGSYVHRH